MIFKKENIDKKVITCSKQATYNISKHSSVLSELSDILALKMFSLADKIGNEYKNKSLDKNKEDIINYYNTEVKEFLNELANKDILGALNIERKAWYINIKSESNDNIKIKIW